MPLPDRLSRPELRRQITPRNPSPEPVDQPLHQRAMRLHRPPHSALQRWQQRLDPSHALSERTADRDIHRSSGPRTAQQRRHALGPHHSDRHDGSCGRPDPPPALIQPRSPPRSGAATSGPAGSSRHTKRCPPAAAAPAPDSAAAAGPTPSTLDRSTPSSSGPLSLSIRRSGVLVGP